MWNLRLQKIGNYVLHGIHNKELKRSNLEIRVDSSDPTLAFKSRLNRIHSDTDMKWMVQVPINDSPTVMEEVKLKEMEKHKSSDTEPPLAKSRMKE